MIYKGWNAVGFRKTNRRLSYMRVGTRLISRKPTVIPTVGIPVGLLSPIRYFMFQIDNVNESKEFLPRILPLSQSTEIKLTMRPAFVTVSLKANDKTNGIPT